MADFKAAQTELMSAKDWNLIRVRKALMMMTIAHGGEMTLTAHDLGALPLGRLLMAAGDRFSSFQYVPDVSATMTTDEMILALSVVVHKAGGTLTLQEAEYAKMPDGRIEAHLEDEDITFVFVPAAAPIAPQDLETQDWSVM